MREALDEYQSSAIVRHPGPQHKADLALQRLQHALTSDELLELRSARGCVLDNAGHHASEFNDACDAIRTRWAREEKL